MRSLAFTLHAPFVMLSTLVSSLRYESTKGFQPSSVLTIHQAVTQRPSQALSFKVLIVRMERVDPVAEGLSHTMIWTSPSEWFIGLYRIARLAVKGFYNLSREMNSGTWYSNPPTSTESPEAGPCGF